MNTVQKSVESPNVLLNTLTLNENLATPTNGSRNRAMQGGRKFQTQYSSPNLLKTDSTGYVGGGLQNRYQEEDQAAMAATA